MGAAKRSGYCPFSTAAGAAPFSLHDPAARLVAAGYRCWLAGYETGDIACWETAWNAFQSKLGAASAKSAVAELSFWVRALRAHSCRPLEYLPYGCAHFCRDECVAISLIAAAQHDHCPAIRACAFALTGGNSIEPVIDASRAFAAVLFASDLRFSAPGAAVSAGPLSPRQGEGVH